MEGGGEWEKAEKKGVGRRLRRGIWTEEGREKFIRRFGKREGGDRGIQEEWRELRYRIMGALEKGRKGGERAGRGGGWDEECREKKSMVRRELRRWRREGEEGLEYRKKKKRVWENV